MARILCIDYGRKRTGLAVTDPDRIIVSGLDTVESNRLVAYLKEYTAVETVDEIVIGHPGQLDPGSSYLAQDVEDLGRALSKRFPGTDIVFHDESFSSALAKVVILASGATKKKRRQKGLVDKMSAVLILQDYLGHI